LQSKNLESQLLKEQAFLKTLKVTIAREQTESAPQIRRLLAAFAASHPQVSVMYQEILLSWESQAIPCRRIPAIEDVWIWLHQFLDAANRTNLRNVATTYRLGPEWSNLWLYQPCAPNQRRI
jgi:hypothetical protein